jgi:hypothetical protein
MKKIFFLFLAAGFNGWFGGPLCAQVLPLAFVQPTGGTTQPIHTWAAVSVKEVPFGAYGDGHHNDDFAINSAITFVAAQGGGEVDIPPGTYVFDQIRMYTNVNVRGQGWDSVLAQDVGANESLVILANNNVAFTGLYNLSLNGNKDTQASGSGISYINAGGNFPFGDSVHVIDHVLVNNIKNDGIDIDSGVRECRVTNVYVNGADGNGFNIACTDSDFVDDTTGSAGNNGWVVNGNNDRFMGCKAFGSGRLSSGSDGFDIIQPRNNLSACEAQDNARHGFLINNAGFICMSACDADSNGVSFGNGFRLDGATNCVLEAVTSFDRGNHTQAYGLDVTANSTGNRISAILNNNVDGDIAPNETGAGNAIRINNEEGTQSLPFSGTITPDPFLGGTIEVTLTGNLSIANPANGHAGSRLTFILTQDESGGRTVDFGTAYAVNNFGLNMAPNDTNVITFQSDGTMWQQVSSVIGL